MERSRVRQILAVLLTGAIATVVAIVHGVSASWTPSLVEEAEQHFRAGLFEPAERSFREALAHDALSAPAHLGLARTLMARREVEEAQGEAEVAVHLSPEEPQAHLTLATLREQAGDLPNAAVALDRYLAAGPHDDRGARRHRAQAHSDLLRMAGSAPLQRFESGNAGTVPFEIVEDKLVVKASVNGRIPIDVVLDTGAEHLMLSEHTVRSAGLPRTIGGAGRGPAMTLVDAFEVAGVVIRRVPAMVRPEPLRVVRNRTGDAFSPVALGLSAIIDYERRELTVARRLPFEPADVELPLFLLGLPVIVGRSQREPLSFVVDTGSEATAMSPAALARSRVAPAARRIRMRLFDAWGKREADAYLLTPGIDLAFGAIRLQEYPVLVHSWPDVLAVHGFEMAGILGHNFLRRYRVTIDLSRRVVRLKRQLPERPAA